MEERFYKVLAAISFIFFLTSILWFVHHNKSQQNNFSVWREQLLSKDIIQVNWEDDGSTIDASAFRAALLAAIPYELSHDRALTRGIINVFTAHGDTPINYVIFKAHPNTIMIYRDDYGYWRLNIPYKNEYLKTDRVQQGGPAYPPQGVGSADP